MTAAIAEDRDKKPIPLVEVRNNAAVTDPGYYPKLLPMEIKNTNVSKLIKRSIKMIVGGQSTDGLAKQVKLPVRD